MVVAIPDWDLINNPKQKTRTRRVKKVEKIHFEEPATEAEQQDGNERIEEDAEESENEDGNDDEKDKAGGNDGTSERQEAGNSEKDKDVGAQKERRTKKRNDRPSSSDDDDHIPLSAKIPIKRQKTVAPELVRKKLKTVASRPSKKAYKTLKGRISKPNVVSTSEAQHIPPLSPTIDVTKPISMILPDSQPKTVNISSSSSSDSEDTLSDSSNKTIDILIRNKQSFKPKPL
jgi:hypothetical protein